MKRSTKIIIFCCLFAIYGCAAGNKILKETDLFEPNQPLGFWSDSVIAVRLDWIVVRDGPGSWATNADWDQYIFRLENLSDSALSITNVYVVDLMGTKVAMLADRKRLMTESKIAVKRYENIKLKVQEGAGTAVMTTAVIGGTVAGGMVAVAGGVGTMLGAGAGAGILLVAGPLIAVATPVAMVVQARNRAKVDRRIKALHSYLPQGIASGNSRRFDLFFPMSPSPQRVVVEYVDSEGSNRSIELDTSAVLKGLHLPEGVESFWSRLGTTGPAEQ